MGTLVDQREASSLSARSSARVPHPSFFEGWDSTIVPRSGFLADLLKCSLVGRATQQAGGPPLRLCFLQRWGAEDSCSAGLPSHLRRFPLKYKTWLASPESINPKRDSTVVSRSGFLADLLKCSLVGKATQRVSQSECSFRVWQHSPRQPGLFMRHLTGRARLRRACPERSRRVPQAAQPSSTRRYGATAASPRLSADSCRSPLSGLASGAKARMRNALLTLGLPEAPGPNQFCWAGCPPNSRPRRHRP